MPKNFKNLKENLGEYLDFRMTQNKTSGRTEPTGSETYTTGSFL